MLMITRRARSTKMQNISSLTMQRVARDTTMGGIRGEAARTGEGVMMLGSQDMARMQKGGGAALIWNTSQSAPTTNPRTSSRTQVSMNKAQDLQLQDRCTGSAATTGATALVVTLSSGILHLPQLLILTKMNDLHLPPRSLSFRNSLLSSNSQQVECAWHDNLRRSAVVGCNCLFCYQGRWAFTCGC